MVDHSKLIQPDDVSDKPFIFVSYSRQDMQEAQGILRILRNNHFRFGEHFYETVVLSDPDVKVPAED